MSEFDPTLHSTNDITHEDVDVLAAIAEAQARLPKGTPTPVSRTASALQGSSVLDHETQKRVATPREKVIAPHEGEIPHHH